MAQHPCPVTGCTKRVSYDVLMCPKHWFLVPKPLRTAVWRAWDNGVGAGRPAHRAAVTAAIDAVNAHISAHAER